MTDTPRTNEALAAILERDGELSEKNAPEVLVKLCRAMECKAEELNHQLARSQAAGTIWYRRCLGEDAEWHLGELTKLAQERDAAIAELEAWRSEKGPEGWWVEHSDHMAQLEVWRDENAGLKDLLENTITERDRLKRNYDHERELRWQTLEKYRMHHEEAERLAEQYARYVAALLQIANTDYRGNRSHESQIAYKSLNPTTPGPPSQPASSPSSPPASSADA